jgi:hypothetical protein
MNAQIPATLGRLKIPVFTKSLTATSKRADMAQEEASQTIKKPKKPDSDKQRSQDALAPTHFKGYDQTGGATKAPTNTLERLLLEAGICWANFASFMSIQVDASTILQPLQVAQLKQIVKMNPKRTKVSGTKNDLVERIVAMLKAA